MKRNLIIALCFIFVFSAGCNFAAPIFQPAPTPTQTPRPPQDTVVSLTFDDGNADNFTIEPVLKEYGLHATFYIPSGLTGTPGFMTWDQLQVLQADGNEIGGHTLGHVKLQGLDTPSLKHQICDDRTNLINHGFNPISFAYPFGNFDEHVQQMVQYCGYLSARTVIGGLETIPPADPYALRPSPYIVSDTNLAKLERYVWQTRKNGGGWVILIFHHVCNACDFFSVKPDVFDGFIPWLAQQQSAGHAKVMTVGEVISPKAAP